MLDNEVVKKNPAKPVSYREALKKGGRKAWVETLKRKRAEARKAQKPKVQMSPPGGWKDL